ncbi:MAG: ammonia-forming cytochrome c nitrite reductase subunit c552 [Gemmataceae bacterium]|nr:ammonia-forming cytochrome c nitrite reductase subunit c552 [Gemmataceae bacterium]
MSSPTPQPEAKSNRLKYLVAVVLTAATTFGIFLLLQNIAERKQEAKQHIFRVVELTEDTLDPAEWGKNYPRQYDSYKKTSDTERPRYLSSEALPTQLLDVFPSMRLLYAGYPFARDYRAAQGHAHMLSDQDLSPRTLEFNQYGACLHCHASNTKAYKDAGRKAGVPDSKPWQQLLKGFEVICPMPLAEARKLVAHPVACIDCHDPDSLQLRVTRPGFLNGIKEFAKSDAPAPHLPSVTAWRQKKSKDDYDPNLHASRQEMRALVCGQCHVEYYFKGKEKLVTYPWAKGLKIDDIEAYYEEIGFVDWTHEKTKTQMLKAQHPEFEMWSQGIHARNGVACADCHMPYKREGAIKISDHEVRSPMLMVSSSCQICHRASEQELKDRVAVIQDRNKALVHRTETALVDLIAALESAVQSKAGDEELKKARALHRKAQFRLDFVMAENSMGFHAPQEAARILGEAIDYARQGQIEALKLTNAKR